MIINKLFILTISFSVRYARCLNISNNLVQVMLKRYNSNTKSFTKTNSFITKWLANN